MSKSLLSLNSFYLLLLYQSDNLFLLIYLLILISARGLLAYISLSIPDRLVMRYVEHGAEPTMIRTKYHLSLIMLTRAIGLPF